MDFTAARYFDQIDADEKEQERVSPTPKETLLERIWGWRTAIV